MTSLQTLLDEREIVRGLARFARIADAKSFDELDGVFAQDLTERHRRASCTDEPPPRTLRWHPAPGRQHYRRYRRRQRGQPRLCPGAPPARG